MGKIRLTNSLFSVLGSMFSFLAQANVRAAQMRIRPGFKLWFSALGIAKVCVSQKKQKQHENQQLKLNLYLFAQNWNANFCFVKYLVFMYGVYSTLEK